MGRWRVEGAWRRCGEAAYRSVEKSGPGGCPKEVCQEPVAPPQPNMNRNLKAENTRVPSHPINSVPECQDRICTGAPVALSPLLCRVVVVLYDRVANGGGYVKKRGM